ANVQRAANNPTGAELARQRAEMTRAQVNEATRQLAALKIVAPAAGVVVAASRVPEPKLQHPRIELGGWHGTPLDAANRGCLLEPGMQVLGIAPDDQFQAILLIDQADRIDLDVGRELEIKFDHLAEQTYKGTVREIAERHIEFAPEALSNKQG